MNSGIYTATYSGVGVYETMILGVPVMRRIHDSYMNATQILKVAGVPKPKRTKILEREVSLGDYEKIQGGYGKYQGTWITLEASIRLAKSYDVSDVLGPLITFDPSKDTLEPKPQTASRSVVPSDPGTPKLTRLRAYRSTVTDLPSPQLGDGELEENDLGLDSMAAQDTFITPKGKNSPYYSPRRKFTNNKRQRENEIEMILDDVPKTPMFGEILSSMVINRPSKILEIIPSDASILPVKIRQKEILKMIYVYGDSTIPTILGLLTNSYGIEIDLVLDEEENTPLHWAAATCQLSLVAALVEKGANLFKTNIHGETAVMRALDFSSVYRQQCGPELFLLLRDSVYAVDVDEQTILHHLAQGSLTKDNWKFTRYYTHCIFKFLKREAMTGVEIQEYLDSQDFLKNTALHYAIRQRFYKFAEMLIKLGSRTDIPNLSGQTAAQLAGKDFKMSRIFKHLSKDNYVIFNSDIVDYDLLDDDMPTPTLSEFSDEEDIVAAAESLVNVKSEFETLSNTDLEMNDTESTQMIKTEPDSSKSSTHKSEIQKEGLNSSISDANKDSEIQSSLDSPKNAKNSVDAFESSSFLNQTPFPKTVIPNASPRQIQKIKRLLENVQDDIEEIGFKKARIASIYEEAKELEIKSKFMDEKNRSSSPIIPPSENQELLDDTLVELMNDHISELQDQVKNAIQNRRKMFSAIEGLEASRAAKDLHFRQSFSSTLGIPLEQLAHLLNDRIQEGSDGPANQ